MTSDRFPFGAPSTPRPPREPITGPARVAVVGVYPSALHVRWTLPTWAVERLDVASHVTALAIDVEPVVFWDGRDPAAADLVSRWKAAVGFEEGDDDGYHGHAVGAMNGMSGVAVGERVLAPLGIDPSETFFTDLVPRFFLKRSGGSGSAQANRIDDTYTPFARAAELPAASLPNRPTPARLVQLTVTEAASRLRGEIAGAGADLLVTLGEEARWAVAILADDAGGPPTSQLRCNDSYGLPGRLRIDDYRARWVALTHPGNRTNAWRGVHDAWSEHAAQLGG